MILVTLHVRTISDEPVEATFNMDNYKYWYNSDDINFKGVLVGFGDSCENTVESREEIDNLIKQAWTNAS